MPRLINRNDSYSANVARIKAMCLPGEGILDMMVRTGICRHCGGTGRSAERFGWRTLQTTCPVCRGTGQDAERARMSTTLVLMDGDPISPDAALRELRAWLRHILELQEIQARGESDRSGHPHTYSVYLVPDWDVRQKLTLVEDALGLSQ